MKVTLVLTTAALVLADTALAFRLPAFLEPREQQQQPKCSLYSGFKDSPSFTSFCRQLPRATRPIVPNLQAATTSSVKRNPSISTERFTFEGGQTSTMSPVHPAVSSAAGGSTFELHNYTVTTSGKPSGGKATTSSKALPSDVEINCYISGSKVPMSMCTKTSDLTRHHGYTYSLKTTSVAQASSTRQAITSSAKAASASAKPASTSSAASSSKASSSAAKSTSSSSKSTSSPGKSTSSSSKSASSSGKSTSSSSKPASSSSKVASSSSARNTTTSAPVTAAGTTTSRVLTSTNCTNTMNLTRHHGYTFADTLITAPSTAKLTSSSASSSGSNTLSSAVTASSTKESSSTASSSSSQKLSASAAVASSTKKSSSSVATSSGKVTSSSKASTSGSTLSTSYTNSADCNNTTNAEPHQMGTLAPARPISSAPKSSSNAQATTSSKSVSTSTSRKPGSVSTSSASKSSIASSKAVSSSASSKPSAVSTSSSRKANALSSSSSSKLNAVSTSTSSKALATSSARAQSNGDYFTHIAPAGKFAQTSITTVVDATITSVVPCATDIGKPAEQKRDDTFMATTAGGICDAGVYCVNSTFTSDAPPSWRWDAVPLKQGQACLEDNVFNTAWVEQQCACAGL